MKKLLIYEDDETTAEVMVLLFQESYEVKTKSNVNMVLEDVQQFQPDLVLMDLRIPETGGEQATKKIKQEEQWKNLPVIIISADTRLKEKAESSGADDYISKPFEIDDLVDLVDGYASRVKEV